MNKRTQLAIIDTETTGLSPSKHEVIEVGILRTEEWYEDDVLYTKCLSESVFKVRPLSIETADPIALKINGYTAEKWKDADEPHLAFPAIAKRITIPEEIDPTKNKLILVGQNIHFDIAFLVEMFRRHSVDYDMSKRAIDVYSVALKSIGRQNLKSFALGSLCEYFGIKHKDRHTAMGDVYATYEVYKKLFNITEVT